MLRMLRSEPASCSHVGLPPPMPISAARALVVPSGGHGHPSTGCIACLWNPEKANPALQLPRGQRDKVCSGCKTRAEGASWATRDAAPASPRRQLSRVPPASMSGPPALHQLSTVAGPSPVNIRDSGAIDEAIAARTKNTRPEEISLNFFDGARRTHLRVMKASKVIVGNSRRADGVPNPLPRCPPACVLSQRISHRS